MRILAIIVVFGGWIGAGVAAVMFSTQAVDAVERAAAARVAIALSAAGQDWAVVDADGLRITLSGRAPSAGHRENALSVVSLAVGASSVQDRITAPDTLRAEDNPLATISIGRFGDLTTLNGRLTAVDEIALVNALPEEITAGQLQRFTTVGPTATPEGWSAAQATAITLAEQLEFGTVTLDTQGFQIDAHFPTPEALAQFETLALAAATQHFNRLPELNLSAPQPPAEAAAFAVIRRGGNVSVTECVLPEPARVQEIFRMVRALGSADASACIPNRTTAMAPAGWERAAVAGLTGMAGLDDASMSLAGRALTLQSASEVSDARRASVEQSVLEVIPVGYSFAFDDGVTKGVEELAPPQPSFAISVADGTATLTGATFSNDGTAARDLTIVSYAEALFGRENVADTRNAPNGAEIAPSLSESLTIIDAATVLDAGEVVLTGELLSVTGEGTGHAFELRQRFENALGQPIQNIAYDVTAVPARSRDGTPVEPTAQACADDIATVQRDARIAFAPSSAVINEQSGLLLDQIAEILAACPSSRFRIEGHTDSQGSETVNLAISTARAESVLDALLIRGIFLDRLEAEGFGESNPIADNDTETGRALNRRIEFSVIEGETP